MSDHLERLASSLFASTSAFAQDRERKLVKPEVSEVPEVEKVGRITFSAHPKIAAIIDQLEIHLDGGDLEDVYNDLAEIRELL